MSNFYYSQTHTRCDGCGCKVRMRRRWVVLLPDALGMPSEVLAFCRRCGKTSGATHIKDAYNDWDERYEATGGLCPSRVVGKVGTVKVEEVSE